VPLQLGGWIDEPDVDRVAASDGDLLGRLKLDRGVAHEDRGHLVGAGRKPERELACWSALSERRMVVPAVVVPVMRIRWNGSGCGWLTGIAGPPVEGFGGPPTTPTVPDTATGWEETALLPVHCDHPHTATRATTMATAKAIQREAFALWIDRTLRPWRADETAGVAIRPE
jgi:hypothetical protein